MKIIIANSKEEYKKIATDVKSVTIAVFIKISDNMYQVKKGRYCLRLPRFLAYGELIELILHNNWKTE